MTVSSIRLPLHFHDIHSRVAGRGGGGAVEHGNTFMPHGHEAQAGAAVSRPASAHEGQVSFAVARGIDVGFLLSAIQDMQSQRASVAGSRSAYADAVSSVGTDAPAPAAIDKSEADYALNP